MSTFCVPKVTWIGRHLQGVVVAPIRWKSSAVSGYTDKEIETTNQYEQSKPFSEIPGPKGLPWLGNWLNYKLDPSLIDRRDLFIKDLQLKYGDIVKESFAGRTIIHLFNLEYIKQIYEAEGKYPEIPALLDTIQFYRKTREMAPGLGNSNGEEWYKLRSIVQQMIVRPQKALDYLPGQNEVANDFMITLDTHINEQGELPHLNNWFLRWGLESAAKTCLDMRMNYLDGGKGSEAADKIIEANSQVFDLSVKLWFSLPLYKYLPTPSRKKLFEHEDFINNETLRLLDLAVDEFKKTLEQGEMCEGRFRFLSYLIGKKEITTKDMRAVVTSVLNDTLSTTSQAILFNLYTLANNPEAQEKAYQEAKTILSASGDLTADGFNSCSYIKACMKETFRFLPIGIDIQRYCPANMVIGGYQVPQGTYLVIEPYLSQHSAEFVSQPEKFIPERWLRDADESRVKLHPYLLIPFSIGTRMCAGRRFAEQELVILIAKILKRYHLEWHHGELHQRFRLLQVPDQEVRVKFVPR